MTNVFFTSDHHFGHLKVAVEHRGFATTDEHDQALIQGWESTVAKRDTVWVLGDLTLASPTRALEIIKGLPGTKHFIAGNHDGCHSMHKGYGTVTDRFREAFDSIATATQRKIDRQPVNLSHFPYTTDRPADPGTPDEVEARFPQWRLPDLGVPLLHGHTHSTLVHTSDHELHIGVDAHQFKPVPMDVVVDWLRSR